MPSPSLAAGAATGSYHIGVFPYDGSTPAGAKFGAIIRTSDAEGKAVFAPARKTPY
jgi:hypothetical protein